MVQNRQRRVTRGASAREITPRRGNVKPDVVGRVQEEARVRIVEQPALDLDEKIIGNRVRVVIPRLTKLLEAFDSFRQVGNDELYRLTPGEKQYILGVLWGKMTELRNSFKYGRRGPVYVTLDDLLAHAGPGTLDDLLAHAGPGTPEGDLAPPEGENY